MKTLQRSAMMELILVSASLGSLRNSGEMIRQDIKPSLLTLDMVIAINPRYPATNNNNNNTSINLQVPQLLRVTVVVSLDLDISDHVQPCPSPPLSSLSKSDPDSNISTFVMIISPEYLYHALSPTSHYCHGNTTFIISNIS